MEEPKILHAIAAGNTIVLKPSELTPTTSVAFAEAPARAGIPDGVVNVVTGPGPTVGEALVTHRDVRMVTFTGSTAAGSRVGSSAAAAVKRVHLELGGKAPFVVFDAADVEAAARGAVAGSLINAGQDCTAATRAYVQRPVYDTCIDRVAELMSQVLVGAAWTSEVFRAQLAGHVVAAGWCGSTTTSRSSARCRTVATRPPASARDMSTYSFDEYTQVKHVMSALSPRPRKDWHDVVFTSQEDHDGGESRVMTA